MQLDKNIINRYIIFSGIFALGVAIGLYAYLGSFSRYLADDYCEAVRVQTASSPIDAVITRYTSDNWPRVTMRYSNLLFIGVSEWLWKDNIQTTFVYMILFWFLGVTWSIIEIQKFLKIHLEFWISLILSATFVFLTLLQAPNLFQTIFWRSAMMTHFAPLVFGSFLFAFIIFCLRQEEYKTIPFYVYLLIFIGGFIFAGFSEPPTTTALTALSLTIFSIKFLFSKKSINKYFLILSCLFVGVLSGLITMFLSPASVPNEQENTIDLINILAKSFLYSYQFIIDTVKTLPLPILISICIPFSLIWLYQQTNPSEIAANQRRTIWIIIICTPFLIWLLIAASFSPSVYGQSFPVERARFLARCMMIASFMLTGGLLGFLTTKIQLKSKPVIGQWLMLFVLVFASIIYPLRTAYFIIIYDVPAYQERTELWDLRDAFIRRHASQGETDLIIPSFSGVEGIKELDDNPNHWINACAAQFYGVNSIRTVTVRENLIEVLSE